MTTITCQYTGIQFEAESRRTKNHPMVSALLTEAAKDRYNPGAYRQAIAAFEVARQSGMTDINEVITLARDMMANGAQAARQQRESIVRQQREADEARHQRRAQNEHLRAHGYTWSKDYADFDEYEEGEPSLWTLRSADNRVVTVAQALDEIERGAEIVLAEIATQQISVTERQEAAEFEETIVKAAYEQVKAEAQKMPEVEAFDDSNFEVQVEMPVGWLTWSVRFGEINGVRAAVVVQPASDDNGRGAHFYCADPDAAGLVRTVRLLTQPGSLDDTFSKFFG